MERPADWFDSNSDYPPNDREISNPERFPHPHVDNCSRISTNVLHNGRVVLADNVIIPTRDTMKSAKQASSRSKFNIDEDDYSSDDSDADLDMMDDPAPTKAYWFRRQLREAIFGTVWYAVLLIPSTSSNDADWEATNQACAIKEMDYAQILEMRGSAENPMTEVAAMQYGQEYLAQLLVRQAQEEGGGAMNPVEWTQRATNQVLASHVMLPLDVLTDTRQLYLVMPFIPGGELFDVLQDRNSFTQEEARSYLLQMLEGIEFLQRAGICHRDLSLENLLTDAEQRVVVIDFGMCLKIPYLKNNRGGSFDHRERDRCLMTRQGSVGKPYYMSPEIVRNRTFDGYAIDLWALGPILFLMVTGFPPWERAIDTDQRFNYFANGYLQQTIQGWNLGLDPDLLDLLQRMFWRDPRMRLSLEQVREHPWVING